MVVWKYDSTARYSGTVPVSGAYGGDDDDATFVFVLFV